jgi:hypothetical protein
MHRTKKSSMTSLQHMPLSATVWSLQCISFSIGIAGSRRTSYVKKNNFGECKVTQPEPSRFPNGHRLIAPDSRNNLSTPPPDSVVKIFVRDPLHVPLALRKLHLTSYKTHGSCSSMGSNNVAVCHVWRC